jgi:hypothetical protein
MVCFTRVTASAAEKNVKRRLPSSESARVARSASVGVIEWKGENISLSVVLGMVEELRGFLLQVAKDDRRRATDKARWRRKGLKKAALKQREG